MRISSLLSLLFIGVSTCLQANNIQVSNISFDEDLGNDIYTVHFDIAWENSWRTSTHESNYDAAWVFLKWKSTNNPDWQHGNIDQVQNTPTGSEVILPSDAVGVFVQRSADGIGDISFIDIQLAWLHNEFDADEVIEICIYAIEMVYIPEGPFQVGDRAEVGDPELSGRFEMGDSGLPYTISSEDELTLGGTSVSNLSNNDYIYDDFNYSETVALPSVFPKGFQNFYSMKYEISQGQYASFVSMTGAPSYLESTFGDNGQTINKVGIPERYEAENPDRAAGYLSWYELIRYADWVGLRPMTELEFEKLCRGPVPATENEFAWGNNSLTTKTYEFASQGSEIETVTNHGISIGNAIWNETVSIDSGPKDCGLFASAIMNPERQESGAGYYGVMELSGNVMEMVVRTGSEEGREYDGLHGDGVIGLSINDLPSGWPLVEFNGNNQFVPGAGRKGGAWISSFNQLEVSDRTFSFSLNYSTAVESFDGGRLVRSNF